MRISWCSSTTLKTHTPWPNCKNRQHRPKTRKAVEAFPPCTSNASATATTTISKTWNLSAPQFGQNWDRYRTRCTCIGVRICCTSAHGSSVKYANPISMTWSRFSSKKIDRIATLIHRSTFSASWSLRWKTQLVEGKLVCWMNDCPHSAVGRRHTHVCQSASACDTHGNDSSLHYMYYTIQCNRYTWHRIRVYSRWPV